MPSPHSLFASTTIASPIDASPCGWYCMAWPTMFATFVYFPSSFSQSEWRMRRWTGLSPSSTAGIAREQIT